ncbi:C-X-C chemokine receptor type 3-2-like [Protopterus annectens]|uniref:C-X-C chemokine receptor type 3-2-like n=1 Tax=Protopterus annectens TaxID=7888 RepID=UPI001CF95F9F|nr:C-X-C chemokine receptor type 3-2-like [Protopterus annectens]
MDKESIPTTTSDYYQVYETYDFGASGAQPCKFDSVMEFNQKFIPPVYSLVFVFGIMGNTLVLLILSRYRHSWAVADTYLLHLTVADLLLVFTLPFWAVQYVHGWIFGNISCKIVGAMFIINLYSSILFLACISFDRYLSIVHAVQMYRKSKTICVRITCIVIWIICILFSLVEFYFRESGYFHDVKADICHYAFDAESADTWRSTLRLVNLVVLFFLPLTVMIYCYSMICRSLHQAHLFERHKSLKVIVSVIAVFLICWAPYNAFYFVDSLQRMKLIERDCKMEHILDTGITITESLGFIHCCLNPIIYMFVGTKFRREITKLFKCGRHRKASSTSSQDNCRPKALSLVSDEENTGLYSVMF